MSNLIQRASARKSSGVCESCGAKLPRRSVTGRPRRYCSERCRKAEFRSRAFDKNDFPTQVSGGGQNPQKIHDNSMACEGQNRGRGFSESLPVNLLGSGYRWSGRRLDAELVRKILRAEVGGDLIWPPAPTGDA